MLEARHRSVCVRRKEDPTYCSCHRFMVRGQPGYEMTAGRAIDVDSLRATRAPSTQSTARESLSLCFRGKAGRVRIRRSPNPPTLFCSHMNSIFGLGTTLANRKIRVVRWWVREYWLREGAARGSPRDSYCRGPRCWRRCPIADRGRVSRRKSHPYPPSEARPLNQDGSKGSS